MTTRLELEEFEALHTPVGFEVQEKYEIEKELENDDRIHEEELFERKSSRQEKRAFQLINFRHEKFVLFFSVSFFAYLGVGTRIALYEFGKHVPNSQNDLIRLLGVSYFLPNMLGCFVMGFIVRWKMILRTKYANCITGITSGFCGCLTTFSSWDVGVATKFINGQWMDAIMILILQFASSYVCFRFGYQVAKGMMVLQSKRHHMMRPIADVYVVKNAVERAIDDLRIVKANNYKPLLVQRIHEAEVAFENTSNACRELTVEMFREDLENQPRVHVFRFAFFFLILSVCLWVLAFAGFSTYTSSRILGVCFAPFGALTRYYLSLHNWKYNKFPLFTFIVNVSASLLGCVCIVIGSLAHKAGGDANKKLYILLGEGAFSIGFLGSLSTVSTWINELDALSQQNLSWAYRYGLSSIVVSQVLSVLILGLYKTIESAPLIQ